MIRGRVIDGAGNPVPDAVLEIWDDGGGHAQALEPDENGRASNFERAATASDGSFSFSVTKPGAMQMDADFAQAPHIAVLVFARGLLRHLLTRMYFPEEAANLSDPVLLSIPEPRRRTLIARHAADDAAVLEWNVVLQGEEETVFFAW
jgi:protocatechuate 3,4-dioxygenase alpha subunit